MESSGCCPSTVSGATTPTVSRPVIASWLPGSEVSEELWGEPDTAGPLWPKDCYTRRCHPPPTMVRCAHESVENTNRFRNPRATTLPFQMPPGDEDRDKAGDGQNRPG